VAVKEEQHRILIVSNIQEFIKFDDKQMADEAKAARGEERSQQQ
jgi:hypothetical protein